MSRSRRRNSQFHEPSLVPLADMLSNTVGIVVFILIFTVLTAGAAKAIKRLPIEHEEKLGAAEYYICENHQIYPLRDDLIHKLLDGVGNRPESIAEFEEFAGRVSQAKARNDFMELTAHVHVVDLGRQYRLVYDFTCAPIVDGDLGSNEVQRPDGFFMQDLKRLNPKKTALIFWVKPDGTAAYHAACELARKAGFSTNWSPRKPGEAITFGTGGGGDKDGITVQ